ncbi:MAG TPA: BamA/TamA family outer membrane protein, partial [Calditrichia bacterium]|nr:BamA/TamA family outer membrane protein [Calditrichia bacterium]
RNLFGTARSLSLQVVPSFYFGREVSSAPRTFNNPKNQISLNFVEPWVLNTRTPGTFQIAYSREKPPLTVRPARNLSTSFNIQHQYDNNWGFTSGVAFEQVNVEDSGTLSVDSTQVTDFRELVPGQDRIYSFQLNPVKDRRDNVLNPHIGYITEFRNQILYASSRLQIARQGELVDTSATNLLYKTTASWVRYQKFPGRKKWTLATRARASGMLEIGKRNNIRLIPESERYYIGGSTTIRGYSERGIGAEDLVVSQNGDTQRLPVGGKYLLLLNAEVRVPVWWLFYGEVFLDAGNIWEEWDDIADNPGLKMGTGLGLAVLTPFGPIRFDYGFKILRESGES